MAAPAAHVHMHEEKLSFWRKYVFSVDHKVIGKQYLFLSLFMALVGGTLAYMLRWQMAWPETPVPGMSWIPEPTAFNGIIPPEFYNAIVTMHGTIMVFFVAMPLLLGAMGNFLIPLMIGAPDMAFPRLNMMSFWTIFLASLVMLASFFVPQGAAAARGKPSFRVEYAAGLVSLDVSKGDLGEVINAIVQKSGLDFVVYGSIRYQIDARMDSKPLDVAMATLLQGTRYSFRKSGNDAVRIHTIVSSSITDGTEWPGSPWYHPFCKNTLSLTTGVSL